MESPISEEKTLKIAAMMATRQQEYTLNQVNGQRIYRRNDDESLAQTDRGCEVFVGRLPRDCYEDELVPIFEQMGSIRVMRLMMDFSGTNRGYAFVLYDCPQAAKRAVETLNEYKLRGSHAIGVMVSWNKTRLFIGGIPKTKNKKEVLKEMRRVTENVKDVILYMSVYNQKNRGFCFVEYETHHDAAMARRRMGEAFTLWGKHDVRVDWADPEPEVDEETMSQVKILHVRNLPLSVSEADLKDIFSFDGLRVERVKKIRDFAFVHYETRSDTEEARNLINGLIRSVGILRLTLCLAKEFVKKYQDLSRIQVTLARPQRCRSTRKRTVSFESLPSVSNGMLSSSLSPPSSVIYYHPTQSQVDNQRKYYEELCSAHNSLATQPMPLYKYDPNDKVNSNFFFVWVPVFMWPNNSNKELTFDDNNY